MGYLERNVEEIGAVDGCCSLGRRSRWGGNEEMGEFWLEWGRGYGRPGVTEAEEGKLGIWTRSERLGVGLGWWNESPWMKLMESAGEEEEKG
ncbi:unnamed protein product [Calypogeia fissa]